MENKRFGELYEEDSGWNGWGGAPDDLPQLSGEEVLGASAPLHLVRAELVLKRSQHYVVHSRSLEKPEIMCYVLLKSV